MVGKNTVCKNKDSTDISEVQSDNNLEDLWHIIVKVSPDWWRPMLRLLCTKVATISITIL